VLVALILACGTVPTLSFADEGARVESGRRLVIERVEIAGNTRTSESLVLAAAGLKAGDAASASSILAAAERLRASRLFRKVHVHSRPGADPGRIIVVFVVKENRPHVRLGLGYEDFSGWYLIPIQLNMDNLTGRGESFNLSSRFGYRLSGLVLTYRRSSFHNPLTYWEVRLRGEGQDRVYFHDGTEVLHATSRGGADFRLGHGLSHSLGVETWIGSENVEADSTAEFYEDRPTLNRHKGDPLSYDELPPEIQDGVPKRRQVRFGLALGLDTREGSGLRTRGIRARSAGEAVLSEPGDFASWQGDLRAYAPLTSGVLAALRLRGGVVSEHAPFHERFYLGGLYSVRGYPSQSLSPPGGNLRIATGSIELRSAWIGPATNPLLVGLAFLDVGVGWNDGTPDIDMGAAGIGYGFRVRLPWIGYLGFDVGRPLSSAPVDEAFRVNMSLGWAF